MKTMMNATPFLFTLFVAVSSSWGQAVGQTANASFDPCPPGTTRSTVVDAVQPLELSNLVYASDVIIVGTVVRGFPSVLSNSTERRIIETHSLVSINQHLSGSLPPNTNTVVITQLGGNVPPCKMVVGDDPIVNPGEQYVLFLRHDNRAEPANTSGSPRFNVVGVWSGKVSIVGGIVRFPSAASHGLHKYDNTDLATFTTILKNLIQPPPPPSPYWPPPLPIPPSPYPRPPQKQ